jgi:hypothetical protein
MQHRWQEQRAWSSAPTPARPGRAIEQQQQQHDAKEERCHSHSALASPSQRRGSAEQGGHWGSVVRLLRKLSSVAVAVTVPPSRASAVSAYRRALSFAQSPPPGSTSYSNAYNLSVDSYFSSVGAGHFCYSNSCLLGSCLLFYYWHKSSLVTPPMSAPWKWAHTYPSGPTAPVPLLPLLPESADESSSKFAVCMASSVHRLSHLVPSTHPTSSGWWGDLPHTWPNCTIVIPLAFFSLLLPELEPSHPRFLPYQFPSNTLYYLEILRFIFNSIFFNYLPPLN